MDCRVIEHPNGTVEIYLENLLIFKGDPQKRPDMEVVYTITSPKSEGITAKEYAVQRALGTIPQAKNVSVTSTITSLGCRLAIAASMSVTEGLKKLVSDF